jgi:hypothetical protein
VRAALLLLSMVHALTAGHIAGPTQQYKTSWDIRELEGHTLRISLQSGFCLGEQRPIAGPTSVVELPISPGHPRPRTIITAHVIAPDPQKTKQEEEGAFCQDLGLLIPEEVHLRRPVAGTVFLDGYYDPPRRVRLPGS